MTIISNRVYRNREPRQAHKRDHRNYVFVECSKCGSPYAIPEGTVWSDSNCFQCDYIALKGMTEADADKLHELLVTCDTDPAHIKTRPTYDQLIHGAKFTNEHRTDDRNWWNEYFSDVEVQKRMSAL